jgi:hypothetical protein
MQRACTWLRAAHPVINGLSVKNALSTGKQHRASREHPAAVYVRMLSCAHAQLKCAADGAAENC